MIWIENNIGWILCESRLVPTSLVLASIVAGFFLDR
jgi:hypothetical protein